MATSPLDHPMLAKVPPVRKLRRDREKLQNALAKVQERQRAAEAKHREQHAAWASERDAAVLDGREPPDPPAPPNLGRHAADYRMVHDRLRQLADEEQAALAGLAPEMVPRLAAAEDEALSQAREHVQALARLADEVTVTREAQLALAKAAWPHRLKGDAATDIAGLVAAVEAGYDSRDWWRTFLAQQREAERRADAEAAVLTAQAAKAAENPGEMVGGGWPQPMTRPARPTPGGAWRR